MEKKNSLIELKNLIKIYHRGDEEIMALNNINLKIESGDFLAIMGPSGSGKSTLMHILGLLDVPTFGEYFFEGQNVSNVGQGSQAIIRNKKIGFIFQQFNLLPRTTVLDNVLLPTIYSQRNENSRNRAKFLINEVGLSDRINYFTNQLSGGQIQRVAIARALMMNPSLILADEPTGNLDTKTSGEIMDLLKSINRNGSTIVLITHEDEIARGAKRHIRLVDGKFTE